jgi:hypothetical protein
LAFAASFAQPRHADALADLKRLYVIADFINPSDDFVARHQRKFRVRQFTVNDVEIGAANATGRNPNAHFAVTRSRVGSLDISQWLARLFQDHCQHLGKSSA